MEGTSGDAYLGGRDFDGALVDYLNAEFFNQHRRNLREPRYHAAYQRLRRVAEQVKIDLSNQEAVPINARDILPAMSLNMSLTREQFQEICAPIFERCMLPVQKALE